eukprot:Gb_28129 [translate_table: standard]
MFQSAYCMNVIFHEIRSRAVQKCYCNIEQHLWIFYPFVVCKWPVACKEKGLGLHGYLFSLCRAKPNSGRIKRRKPWRNSVEDEDSHTLSWLHSNVYNIQSCALQSIPVTVWAPSEIRRFTAYVSVAKGQRKILFCTLVVFELVQPSNPVQPDLWVDLDETEIKQIYHWNHVKEYHSGV